jgi:hypothetical protein
MSTSGLIMISAKEARKLIGFLKWLGALEDESTLGMSDQSTTPVRVMTEEVSFRGHSKAHSLQGSSRALLGHQLQGAELACRGFGRRYGDQPRKLYFLFCGEDKGHTTRTCQVTIQKQKEIAEAEARQNQPK